MKDLKCINNHAQELWPCPCDDSQRRHTCHKVDRADVDGPLESYQFVENHPG